MAIESDFNVSKEGQDELINRSLASLLVATSAESMMEIMKSAMINTEGNEFVDRLTSEEFCAQAELLTEEGKERLKKAAGVIFEGSN